MFFEPTQRTVFLSGVNHTTRIRMSQSKMRGKKPPGSPSRRQPLGVQDRGLAIAFGL
jgi:hypothetical protein